MRSLLAFSLILLASGIATPAAAQLDGTYELATVNGTALPVPSPGEGSIVVERLTVTLGPDARYTMSARARKTEKASAVTLDVSGTYRVAGDTLFLQPDPEAEADDMEVRWTMDGSLLRWRDALDDEYTFIRQ